MVSNNGVMISSKKNFIGTFLQAPSGHCWFLPTFFKSLCRCMSTTTMICRDLLRAVAGNWRVVLKIAKYRGQIQIHKQIYIGTLKLFGSWITKDLMLAPPTVYKHIQTCSLGSSWHITVYMHIHYKQNDLLTSKISLSHNTFSPSHRCKS